MSGAPTQLIRHQLAATVQVGGRTVGRDVLVGIHDASHKTGVNFAYMLAKANQESGFRPDATNPRGTASGLFQFTRATWLDQIAQHGEKHGLGHWSRQIVLDSRGRPHGSTPEVERQILALRSDPGLSAMMAAEYAADNKAYLERALGRPADATDIYLAHFLGPGGAITFLRGMDSDPNASAARLLPKAAANNPTIFSHHGAPRSLRQVHAVLRATIQDAMRRFSGIAQLTEASAPPGPPGARPDAPPPEERGWGLTGTRPPPPPGRRPEGPDRSDLIPLYLAANPPVPPGRRPEAPDRADLMSPEVAARMPPVPGPRPDPDALWTEEPEPAPAPATGPETRVARAAPESPPFTDLARGESVMARVLDATRAVEAAGAARRLDLPGPSALAMAAMLDDLFQGDAHRPAHVLVLDPVAGLTHVPVTAVAAPDGETPLMGTPESVPALPPGGPPSPDRWAAAEPAPAEAGHPAITRILAVGRSVSAAPGETQVSLAVPHAGETRPSATIVDAPMDAPMDSVTAAVTAPGPIPVPTARPASEATADSQAKPPADPAPRWRAAGAPQLAESDARQAIAAILGRPNAG